jgi:hypothetical protein
MRIERAPVVDFFMAATKHQAAGRAQLVFRFMRQMTYPILDYFKNLPQNHYKVIIMQIVHCDNTT